MRVSPEILSLVPYRPGKPISETKREYGLTHVTKLASNENPLGPSPKAVEAIKSALSDLNRYPDPSAYSLNRAVSQVWHIANENISFGNGSNEIIDILIRIYCEPGDRIITTQFAFIAYQICAQAARVKTQFTKLRDNFHIDLQSMANEILADRDRKIRIVFLPNPNNPTGTYINNVELEAFMEQIGRREDLLIVFDEAYNEYVRAKDYVSGQTFLSKYPNVAVVRTMSKVYGLAGLRMGILLAHPSVIDLYNRVRNPFNTNDLAQVAAEAALRDVEFINKSQKLVWEGLDYLHKELGQMGLLVIPSQGNFILFDTLRKASDVYEALLQRGVILRPVGNYGLPRHMRLTVGLPEENKIAIEALKEVIKFVPEILE